MRSLRTCAGSASTGASNLYYTSDYFEQLYAWAVHLIKEGDAYVDDLSADDIRAYRGTLKEPGRNSPFRDRPIEKNLELFAQMRAGKFKDGERVLRAKIDMAAGNINMRDPVLYRILHAHHPRTGDAWCIYPTYDFAHGQSDAIECVTHSLCTLEFEDHRPLYDWLVERLPTNARPHQYEFAKLSVGYSGISLGKRRLRQLVEDGMVRGWDDPRMPTLSGLRRRGTPPEAVRDFANKVGIAKAENLIEPALLEHCIRDHLNRHALRRMAVLRPLKVVIENFSDDQVEEMIVANGPEPQMGTRRVPFSKELYIEQTDFMEDRRRSFSGWGPGREVRHALSLFRHLHRCCQKRRRRSDRASLHLRSRNPRRRCARWRKVKGTLHWVSARHAQPAEIRLYEPLFTEPIPGRNGDFLDDINRDSLEVLSGCMLEPELAQAKPGQAVQFERQAILRPIPTADREPSSSIGRSV